jgi:ZIP family zinc transporter
MLILISIAAFIATFAGGLLALRFRDKLHLVLGFSAGAVIAVAFFDLIPEAFELAEGFREPATIALYMAIGFFAYLFIDRLLFFHASRRDPSTSSGHGEQGSVMDMHEHAHTHVGGLGAGGLVAHSFFDGVAVGLAFQVSVEVGALVATAVLIHKISDGISTVGVVLKGEGSHARALKWLTFAAVAPVFGILSTAAISIPENTLGIMLAVFAGFFIYMGASDLIPESHHAHPKLLTTVMTFLGAGVLYAAISFAGV